MNAAGETNPASGSRQRMCASNLRAPLRASSGFCEIYLSDYGQDVPAAGRRVAWISPQAGIVAMSGGGCNGVRDVLQMARHLGARDILAKPFGSAKLREVVRRALE